VVPNPLGPLHDEIEARVNGTTADAGWPVRFGHADKMDAVARLAGGLSHDVGNLVDEAATAVREAMVELPHASAPQESLEQAAATLQRAAMIARQLQALSEARPNRPERRHLARTVRELLPLIGRLAGPAVRLDAEALGRDTLVRASAGQLEQVLFHLVVNARDAMPHGGVLTIEARRDVLDAPRVHRYGVLPSGAWSILAVTDTGVGMTEAVLQRLFEPFFTTKAPGMGSGLGLATVYGIAQQLGGQVVVHSREHEGTTVELWLPRALPSVAATDEAAVLVVHGDAWLRSLHVRALRRGGVRALEAATVGEAVALLGDIAGQEVTTVVLASGTIPAEDARLLATHLGEHHPRVRLIEIGGAEAPSSALRLGAAFTPEELLAAVTAC
jgi:hypothetical protein